MSVLIYGLVSFFESGAWLFAVGMAGVFIGLVLLFEEVTDASRDQRPRTGEHEPDARR